MSSFTCGFLRPGHRCMYTYVTLFYFCIVRFSTGITDAKFNVSIYDDEMFNCNKILNLTIAHELLPKCITYDSPPATLTIVDDKTSKLMYA